MIIIADNQSLTSDALTSYLAGQPLLFVHTKEELARRLEAHPDAVVVLDFALFDFTSPENFLIYIRRFASAKWLMLSTEYTENLLRLLGAEHNVSFLTKDCTRQDFLQVFYNAQQGRRTVCPTVENQLSNRSEHIGIAHLTHTETEILSLIAEGLTAKEIAARRNSSVHTIVTHKKNIFRKLGVSTAYEAIRYALRSGIADPVEYYI